ncbi:chemotaxis protein CheB [Steroidobacter flavus]|uniref:protein-glutamate methylesterase n=1 Tax=Steroidobacter flavus TaxID=1842136 RepID=A0ABV8SS17_9GAMM
MANRDLVVIGGSAGAVPALTTILRSLPTNLPAAVVVILHVPAESTGIFRTVAAAASALPVKQAEQGMTIERGNIYVARANRHLLVVDGHLRLGTGPRENLVRPAIDPLFRSAALTAGPRVIGVILSGKLNDGASGLAAIKTCGGIALVQAPQHALSSEMPLAALEASPVNLSASPEELASAIQRYVSEAPGPGRLGPPGLQLDVEIALGARTRPENFDTLTKPSSITCPDCGGVLAEIEGDRPLRFRCQVGHAFSAQALLRKQEGQVDEAMRVALRIIEERASLVERMGQDALQTGRQGMAEMYERRAAEYRGYAESLREAVLLRMEAADSSEADSVVTREVQMPEAPD